MLSVTCNSKNDSRCSREFSFCSVSDDPESILSRVVHLELFDSQCVPHILHTTSKLTLLTQILEVTRLIVMPECFIYSKSRGMWVCAGKVHCWVHQSTDSSRGVDHIPAEILRNTWKSHKWTSKTHTYFKTCLDIHMDEHTAASLCVLSDTHTEKRRDVFDQEHRNSSQHLCSVTHGCCEKYEWNTVYPSSSNNKKLQRCRKNHRSVLRSHISGL